MKTAVEWLFEKFMTENTTKEGWHEIFKQAKEMEKEQIVDAAKSCNYIGGATNIEAEQYYNETYGKDKSES